MVANRSLFSNFDAWTVLLLLRVSSATLQAAGLQASSLPFKGLFKKFEMGCSPSKVQDGASPVAHPVVKSPTEPVKETAPAVITQSQSSPDISTQFGNTTEENEAACKVKEGAADEDGTRAVPEDPPATEHPVARPDDSAAAVVQIFGEEGANAVAAAFFDGNADMDTAVAVASSAPDHDSTPAQDDVPTQAEDTVELSVHEGEDVPADAPAEDPPTESMDPGETQDAEADDAAGMTVDPGTSEEAPAPEDNPASTEDPDVEDAAPAADGPAPEEETTAGEEAVEASPDDDAPEHAPEPIALDEDTPPEDSSVPNDDAPSPSDDAGDAEAAASAEDS